MGEVFDHMLKRCAKSLGSYTRVILVTVQSNLLILFARMSYRRQKRWWNAYILFYERLDVMDISRTVDVDRSEY